MMNLFRKWWFWVIIALFIVGMLLLFTPLKSCGALTYGGGDGLPTGTSSFKITYYKYLIHHSTCPR